MNSHSKWKNETFALTTTKSRERDKDRERKRERKEEELDNLANPN